MRPVTLDERLRAQPKLRARIERIVELSETGGGVGASADDVEDAVAQELRALGQEVLQEWAEREAVRLERYWDARAGVTRKEKKSSRGRPASDASSCRSKVIGAARSKCGPLDSARE